MNVRAFYKLLIFFAVCGSGLVAAPYPNATSFSDGYYTVEERFFSSDSLSDVARREMITQMSTLAANYNSFSATQKAYFESLLRDNLTQSSMFTEAERGEFNGVLSQIGVAGAGVTVSVASTGPENFMTNLAKLRELLAQINALSVGGGTLADVTRAKDDSFFPLITKLASSLGDMVTAEYLVAGANIASLPQPSTPLIDEQANLKSFFSDLKDMIMVGSGAFVQNKLKIETESAKFETEADVATRIKFVQDNWQLADMPKDNKIRILWHFQNLVNRIRATDFVKNLSEEQRTFVRTLLSVVSKSAAYADYKTQLATLLQKFDEFASQSLPATAEMANVPAFLQALNGKKLVIAPATQTPKEMQDPIDTILYGSSQVGVYQDNFRLEVRVSYELERQNIFTLNFASDGSILFALSANPTYFLSSAADGSLTMVVKEKPQDDNACKFVIEGTDLTSVNLKHKSTGTYLAKLETGEVRASGTDGSGSSRLFKITTLSDFDAGFVVARAKTTARETIDDYINAHKNILANISTLSADELGKRKKRLFADVKHFIKNAQASIEGWKTFKSSSDFGLLSGLVNQLQSDVNFVDLQSSSKLIKNLLESDAVSTTSSIETFNSLQDGEVVSFRLGDFASMESTYLTVGGDDNGQVVVSMSSTTPADTGAQFKVKKITTGLELESVLSPGYVLAFTNRRGEQDLDLAPKVAQPTQASSFNVVQSYGDPSAIGLVSVASGGYVSKNHAGKAGTFDFMKYPPAAFTDTPNSRLSIVRGGAIYSEINNAIRAGSTISFEKIQTLITENATKIQPEEAVSLLKEIYYYVLAQHSKPTHDSWLAFSDPKGSFYDPLVATIEMMFADNTVLGKVFAPYNTLIENVGLLSNFEPEGAEVTIIPMDNRVFWLTESAFDFLIGSRAGITFSLQTSGVCHVYVADSGDVGKYYMISIGEKNESGKREAAIYFGEKELVGTRVEMSRFNAEDFAEYQVIFDKGFISLTDFQDSITDYQDDKFNFVGPEVLIGFAAEKSQIKIENVKSGFSLYNNEFLEHLQKEPYSASVDKVVVQLEKIKSINDQANSALDLAEAAVELPFRLEGDQKSWTKLQNGLAGLLSKSFIRGNYRTKRQIEKMVEKIQEVPSWQQRRAFLESILEAARYYMTTYSPKSEELAGKLRSIILSNLAEIIKSSFQETEKEFVRNYMTRIQQTGLITDSQVLIPLVSQLNTQILIQVPAGGSLADKITYISQIASQIGTIEQRSTVLGLINGLVVEVIAAQDEAGISQTRNLVASLMKATMFKDILGSLGYFIDVLDTRVAAPEIINYAIAGDAASVVTNLTTYANKLVGWSRDGLDKVHDKLLSDFASQLVAMKINSALISYNVDMNYLISYLQVKGDIGQLINTVEKEFGKIGKVADRDNFLNQFESVVISYVEYQISSGIFSDADLAVVEAFLTEKTKDTWFKDGTAMSRIDDFRRRISGMVSPEKRIVDLSNRFNALIKKGSANEEEVDTFIVDLKGLSSQIRTAISSGGLDPDTAQKSADGFNRLLASVASGSGESSSGAGYLFYIKMNYGNTPLDLKSLEVEVSGNLGLISQLVELQTTLASSSGLNNATARAAFLNNFRKLVTDWKMMVIFEPTTRNVPSTTFGAFYDKFSVFIQEAMSNFALLPNKKDFDAAKSLILEDVSEPEERVTTLKSYLTNAVDSTSGDGVALIGGKNANQVMTAVRNLVDDFLKYRAFTFTETVNTKGIESLIDICVGKAAMKDNVDELKKLKKQFEVIPGIDLRVNILNEELANALSDDAPLSQTQQEGIVEIAQSVANSLKSINKTQGEFVDVDSLKRNLEQLANNGYFNSVESKKSLQAAIKSLEDLPYNYTGPSPAAVAATAAVAAGAASLASAASTDVVANATATTTAVSVTANVSGGAEQPAAQNQVVQTTQGGGSVTISSARGTTSAAQQQRAEFQKAASTAGRNTSVGFRRPIYADRSNAANLGRSQAYAQY